MSALDSSGCSGYVAYQLWATMHTLANLGATQNAGHSLNRYRALSISWTAKLRAGTCHPTEQALCLMTCTNAHRNTHKTIKHNKTQYMNPTTHKSIYVSVWVTTWSANFLLLQVSVWWMCLCNTIWNRPFSNRFSLTSLKHEIGFATTKFDINFRPTGHSFLVTISTLRMQYRILATMHK